jgi:FAD/FMN-containing dehydrogenase
MRALLLGIQAVLPDGRVFDGLTALRKDNRGYDLRQLLCGAEGTLGVVTAAALRLVPALQQRVVAWAGLDSPDVALAVLRGLEARLGEVIESFELVPDDALQLVLRHIPGMRAPLDSAHRWHVLIECGDAAPGDTLRDRLTAALADLMDDATIGDAALAGNERQADQFWALRENISEAERVDGVSAKHDVSVAVSAMPSFILTARVAVEQAFPGVRVIAFGHLGDGNVHFNVRAPEGADSREWLAASGAMISAFVHDLVQQAGGSLSAEHGIGQMKLTEFVRLSDPVRLETLLAIKRALDPCGIMNPGKLLPLA